MSLLLFACVSAPDLDTALDSGPDSVSTDSGLSADLGKLALRFEIDADWRDEMDEDAVGDFFGSFWNGDEVDNLGPMDGADSIAGCDTPGLDLREGATEVLFTSDAFDADAEIVVLGFLDSDGNATPGDEDPDSKDPVTLPHQNRFTVVGGETTEVTVFFGFLNP